MNIFGLHITAIGGKKVLCEPTPSLDVANFNPVLDGVLSYVQKHRVEQLYYDLAETTIIDPVYYHWLDTLARACRSMNVRMICIHMSPTAAFSLAHQLTDKPPFETALGVEDC